MICMGICMRNIKLLKAIKWMLISFILAMIICGFSILNYLELLLKINQSELELNKGHVIYSIQHDGNPLDADLEYLKKLYELLNHNNIYQYFELYNQYLEMPDQKSAFYEYGTDKLSNQCEGINCIQVSENLLDSCEIHLLNGRLFEIKDFIYKRGETLPVLMGEAYSSLYMIGDVFEAEYLFDMYKFEIIGFLSENSNINMSSYNINLDNYIVMPSFMIDSNVPVTDGIKVHYANKTSGLVSLNKTDSDEFYKIIEPMLKNAKVGKFSWTVTPIENQYKEIFKISINQTRMIILFLIIIMLLGEICLIYHFSKYERKIKKHNIFYCIFIIIFSTLVYIAISFLFSISIGVKLVKYDHFVYIGISSFCIVMLNSAFSRYRNIRK